MNLKTSTNRKFKRMLIDILSIFAIIALAFPATGRASAQESTFASALAEANILVNTAEDELNADGDCSLREAIQAANTDTVVDACPAGADSDFITFSENYTITLSSQLPVVTTPITITGNGVDNTIVQANASSDTANYRVFYVDGTGELTVSDLTVRNGRCTVLCSINATDGGGIYNDGGILTISNITFSNNSASGGGAIFSSGTVTVTNGTFSSNSASRAGGIANSGTMAIFNSTFSNNSAWSTGGGISNWNGTLTVSDSSFFANSQLGIYNYLGSARISGSTFSNNSSSSYGGGIYNNAGTMSVTNSTFSGNTTTSYGGGIANDGTLIVSNSTFSGNGALFGGGISNEGNGVLHLKNNILANSTSGADCLNYYATLATNIYNLIEDNSCDPSISGDANLGPLADNGGPTLTHTLLPGSPAIDTGNPDGCTDQDGNLLEVDQRSEPRPVDGDGDGQAVCDIGAYEAGETPPQPSPWLIAFPENDAVEGWEWPAGATVTLTIENAPGLERSGVAAVTTWGDPRTYVRLEFGDVYNLQVGDEVTLTDEFGTTRTHTVQNLTVTGVNADTDSVSGTANIGAVVQVWPHGYDQDFTVEDTAEDGTWIANFGELGFHAIEETGGRSQIVIDGNATAVDWSVPPPPPNPRIEAFAWFDRYSLVDWPADIPIDITIQNPDYQTTFMPDGSSNWYDFFPGVDLQPGSVITATNGETTKVLEISLLSATADANTGVVTGVATPNRTFHMKTDGDHFQLPIEQDITADPAGNWSVTIEDYLPWVWLTRGEMWESDNDEDVTYAIWHVDTEVVEVWLAQNEIRAFGWPLDAALTFNVAGDDIATDVTPQPVNWMESTSAIVNVGERKLEPGMVVTVTGGSITKSTVIQDLKITDIDIDNDVVYGYAPSNADLELGSWEDSPVFRFFNNGADPNWMIDYREPSLNGVTVDLNSGDELRLFMREVDKDSTVWQSFAPFVAVNYVVNTNDDVDDGTCDETHCSLREAINAANTTPSVDTINFNIPGDPPFTIQPQSAFQDIYYPVTIDGTTQPGFEGAPIIELGGTNAGDGTTGLVITANDSVVKGLAINRYSGNGVLLLGHGNTVQGNYIGTDVSGTSITGPAGPAIGEFTVTATVICPIYPVGTNFDGFVSESEDPLAPWSGTSVTFKGTEECGSPEMLGEASLIYRYKLEFAEDTQLTSISVSGAAFNGPDSVLRVLDENLNVLGSVGTFGGNSFQTQYLMLEDVAGTVFYVDEFDTSTTWRFRQTIVINGPLPLGNYGNGVLLAGGATDNLVIDNLISGNISNGVAIFNPGTTGNIVQENYIGTDITGTQSLGNAAPGVGIGDQAYDNFIIGNLVSGNKSDGVAIFNPGTNGNVLQGNNIGTDVNREVALPNAGVGVWIGEGASDTLIGGNNASSRNVISGNKWGGVSINQAETTGTRVQGNYIGTNKNGDAALPNGGDGVYVSGSQTLVGGAEPGVGNVISGNTASGITLTETGSRNIVQGNFIGTDMAGNTMMGPAGPEVGYYTTTLMEACPTYPAGTDIEGFISESEDPVAPWSGTSVHFQGTDAGCGSPETRGAASLIYRYKLEFTEITQLTSIAVSGAAFNGPDNVLRVLDGEMNVLGSVNTFGGNSFQTQYVALQGVEGKTFYIDEFDTSGSWRFRQNIVINGPVPLGNYGNGVSVGNSPDNTIEHNVIAGNMASGVSLYGAKSTGNVMRGNLIGTNLDGTAALPNSDGVWLGESASNNLIGGTTDDARNIISGNNIFGVSINNPGTMSNVVQGNYIGTDINGTGSIPNLAGGVIVTLGALQNRIGGPELGARNVISGNNGDGVTIVDVDTSSNTVQGNFIGMDVTGMLALGNSNRGVFIAGGATDNDINGNVISGNGAAGVRITDEGTNGNQVLGNFIGTDVTGVSPVGNGYVGIRLTDGAANNQIGGTESGAGNIIAFNVDSGIATNAGAGTGNALLSNSIFLNGNLGIDLSEDGITLNDVFDPDTGPNDLQNFPVITAVARKGASVKIHGQLVSSPSTTFRLEFFSNSSCDLSGYGEGQTFLGFVVVTTNPDGNSSFRAILPVSLPANGFVTATATDASGNTSEFSQCFGPVK